MTEPEFALDSTRRRADKLSELVAREIVHDIAARQLPPGTILKSEAELLTRYGVGRATLREALRILEVLGLISPRPGRGGGPVVAEVSSREYGRTSTFYFHLAGATVRELLESRLELEPLMAAVAARRQDEALRADLDRVAVRTRTAATDDDRHWGDAATEFHEVVARMTGNRILDVFSRALKGIYHDRVRALVYTPETRERVRKEHDAIARAINNGDAPKAERLMRSHMEEVVDFTMRRYPGLLDEVVDWR
jgi:DNA-binding FadR family transcriptional regulator